MATGLFGAPRRLPKIDPALGAMLRREQGILPGDQPQIDQMPQMPGMQRKPGLGTRLLGEGWEEKVSALGGLLRGDPNAVGNYQALQQHRADQAAALRQQSLKRDQDWQDWIRKEQYKAANPTPDAFERTLGMAGIDPNSPEGRALARQRAESMARDPNDEFVVVPIPGRGTYAGPRSGLPMAMGQAAAPTAPVGRLTPIQESGASNGVGNFPAR